MSMLFLMNIIIHQDRVHYSNTQIWRSFKDQKLASHVTLLRNIYKILAKLLTKTIRVFFPMHYKTLSNGFCDKEVHLDQSKHAKWKVTINKFQYVELKNII
jgi:hypothetical protein